MINEKRGFDFRLSRGTWVFTQDFDGPHNLLLKLGGRDSLECLFKMLLNRSCRKFDLVVQFSAGTELSKEPLDGDSFDPPFHGAPSLVDETDKFFVTKLLEHFD